LVVLATQTPPTRVLPGPHAAAICVIMLSVAGIGATGIACADVAMAKAKAARAIALIIGVLPYGVAICLPTLVVVFSLLTISRN
jgi:hypothetical protein